MNKATKTPKRPRNRVGSGELVLSGPKVSQERILQLTNDIAEGYKTGTKEELREAVRWWSLKHAECVCRERALATEVLVFALDKIKAAERGARENVKNEPRGGL